MSFELQGSLPEFDKSFGQLLLEIIQEGKTITRIES